ncbi:transcriptional regulator, SarA/Rot family, partial [Streptomyces globisporus]
RESGYRGKWGEHFPRTELEALRRLSLDLESAGLVRRERSREDERSVVIDLTDEGAGLRERALSVPRGVLAATGLSLEEVLGLQEILGRLTGALGEAADAD